MVLNRASGKSKAGVKETQGQPQGLMLRTSASVYSVSIDKSRISATQSYFSAALDQNAQLLQVCSCTPFRRYRRIPSGTNRWPPVCFKPTSKSQPQSKQSALENMTICSSVLRWNVGFQICSRVPCLSPALLQMIY